MSDVSELVSRIRTEITATKEKYKQRQQEQIEAMQAKQRRLDRLEVVFDGLRDTLRPRLEALAKEFGEHVQVTPSITPGQRQATFRFKSPIATVCLKFTAGTDLDATQVVLRYDLEILPILMEFEHHAQIAFPLDQVDPKALANWLDDRIVQFVKTYLAIHENPYYLRDQMVDDPIAGVRFPKFVAAATRVRGKETYYFIGEESAAEFDKRNP